jgi:hypothetical protein
LKTSPYSIFSNHVQYDNEHFRVSGLPICHLHMSTFLNACVPSLSFEHVFSMAFLTSLDNSNRSLS